MTLENQIVTHKIFGEGKVVEHDDSNYMLVQFSTGNKKFKYPDAFGSFLTIGDVSINTAIKNDLAIEMDKQRAEGENKRMKAEIARKEALVAQEKAKKAKTYPRENVAFKCNYSDGGKTDTRIGYCGVCSDEIIKNNIEIEKRTWCSSESSECAKYLRGEIRRAALDAIFDEGGFLCYESQMLRNWKAMAGIVQQGERKGQPMKLNQVQSNSLCVLTTRNPNSEENDRYIFAVFLVDETYEGDGQEEGYVTTSSPYRISLAPQEAESIRFWSYHANDNNSDIAAWNTGLHRYFNDKEAMQILFDISEVKKGTPDEELAKDFLEYFASVARIDLNEIPPKNGALNRNGNKAKR